MTTELTKPEGTTPLLRFLFAMVRWVTFWRACIVAAIGLTVIGFQVTIFSLIAIFGVIWLPVLILIHWGRMLDETLHFRSDMEEGPW